MVLRFFDGEPSVMYNPCDVPTRTRPTLRSEPLNQPPGWVPRPATGIGSGCPLSASIRLQITFQG